jgi:hypothetical protein
MSTILFQIMLHICSRRIPVTRLTHVQYVLSLTASQPLRKKPLPATESRGLILLGSRKTIAKQSVNRNISLVSGTSTWWQATSTDRQINSELAHCSRRYDM